MITLLTNFFYFVLFWTNFSQTHLLHCYLRFLLVNQIMRPPNMFLVLLSRHPSIKVNLIICSFNLQVSYRNSLGSITIQDGVHIWGEMSAFIKKKKWPLTNTKTFLQATRMAEDLVKTKDHQNEHIRIKQCYIIFFVGIHCF